MDEFLATVGVQAMRYAIRSGIALTSTYALGQCSRLLKSVEDQNIISELKLLRKHLDCKIKIISPAIDLIEFKSGKGNVFLESAAPLAKSLHQEIVSLAHRIETAAEVEEEWQGRTSKARTTPDRYQELAKVIAKIKELLARIDREVPLLQLAISASGESLSTSLPAGISPSRLLQASTFLIVGDTQFAQNPNRPIQVGPAFTLSIYMLFLGHAATFSTPTNHSGKDKDAPVSQQSDNRPYGLGEKDRKPLWQEVVHKARVRLCRIRTDYGFNSFLGYQPHNEGQHPSAEGYNGGYGYSYHLEIIEDLDDGRLHDEERKGKPYDNIASAGIRESIPIRQLSKIFYTDTGRILNLGSAPDGDSKPVLLLKRDVQAPPCPIVNPTSGFPDTSDFDYGDYSDGEEDTQHDIDRQIKGESNSGLLGLEKSTRQMDDLTWKFPAHLDPEWIALEVHEEDDDASSDNDDDGSSDWGGKDALQNATPTMGSAARNQSSLDSRVVDQIRNLSLQPSVGAGPSSPSHRSSTRDLATDTAEVQDFVARSPFGAITSSLSLMEMLIRLTSLQEYRQASHLSIPDYLLTFFLEETSTTGFEGEKQWKTRSEAKRRMGFDPYTDTPTD